MPYALDHIALMVTDPARSAELLAGIFPDARVSLGTGDHDTFVDLDAVRLVLVAGRAPAERNGDHLALRVDAGLLPGCAQRARTHRLDVQWARGDTALYITDADNHVFELVAATP